MAKGQVSEEELTKALKGIGNFGGLSSSARVRRDNPFRDSRSGPAAPEPVKTIEVKPTTVEAKPPKTVSPALEPKPVRTVVPVSKPAAKAQVAERKAKAVGGRKADIFRLTDFPGENTGLKASSATFGGHETRQSVRAGHFESDRG